MENYLSPLVQHWISKIRLARDFKWAKFGQDARECMRFFRGPHTFMYAEARAGIEGTPDPWFKMSYNKVAELVQLFGPVLYQKNPVRTVTPRQFPMLPPEYFGAPQDPAVQQTFLFLQQQVDQARTRDEARATLLQAYLNYTPQETNLKDEARQWIDEALIKGLATLWTEVVPANQFGMKLIKTSYDTVDNFLADPDAERLEDATWIARRCVHPVWQVEREYGLPPGSLKANQESLSSQAFDDEDAEWRRKQGRTNDLCVYWKIWSKMGMGTRLAGISSNNNLPSPALGALGQVLDQFGDHCFLVVAEGTPWPLNLPPPAQVMPPEQVMPLVSWPVPYWADQDWPVTVLAFHKVPRSLWPMSHIKPALGELKFLNWAFSFLASKMRITSRDFLVVLKSAGEQIREQILKGDDLSLLELDQIQSEISKVVQFLQHPPMNKDLLSVIEAVKQSFDQRTGLTELMFGQSESQFRSASEAEIKAGQINVRPGDMAEIVEEAMSAVARKEAIAARLFLGPQDVAPVIGDVGAFYWQQEVMSADLNEVVHQLQYRIEAGSTRKPNRERQAQNMSQAMQTLFGPLMQYASATGDVNPVNALIGDWAMSIDLQPRKYLMQPPPPPPAPAPAGGSSGNGKPQEEPAEAA